MYKIIRFYYNSPSGTRRRVVARNLTLEEAQEHCRDKETSSSTATKAAGKRRTKVHGPWFDGYEEQ